MRHGGIALAVGRVSLRTKKPNPHPKHTAARPPNHDSTAIVANSRRLATTQVPRVRTSSPPSVDDGFVEIGHVQVLQTMVQKHGRHRQRTRGRQTGV